MSKVSLRVYNHEIEGMIDSGQLEDAIAHCLHILKIFPMHLETYRLFGKAFLEIRQYANAADIFRRILMAAPDDFVSHVGMSIIADDENKLDNAIWHMERAFEVQPSNPAIQSELRRLYGRREGVEPPKIRLTRDALANMYAQGELYNQAIAEIRSVLAEDPARPDLQIMLARAYFRAGQKVEATEMCSALLKKYPFCLDALRILTEILPGTGRAENTQVYRHRINSLDPYAAYATASVFQSDKVPDAAVNLERLEYEPGTRPASSQPDWASSLGIKLEEPSGRQAAPDWLNISAEQESRITDSIPVESETGKQEAIPDWMRSIGWTEATGEAVEGPVDFHEGESAAEPIAQADIPDWLKSMAPPEVLQESQGAADEPISFGEYKSKPAGDEQIPDWLRPSEPSKIEEPLADLQPAPSLSLEPTPSQDGGPDWLQSLKSDQAEESPVPVQPEPSILKEPAAIDDELPDWLKDLTPAAEVVPAVEGVDSSNLFGISDGEEKHEDMMTMPETEKPGEPQKEAAKPFEGTLPSIDDQDAAMAWLESLAAKQGAKEEELLTKPEDRLENAPDWVKKLSEDESAAPPSEEIQEVVGLEAVEELPQSEAPAEAVPAEGDTTLDWLASLSETVEPKPEETFEPIEEKSFRIQEEIPLAVEETTAPALREPIPEEPKKDEDASVTTWLRSLPTEEQVQEEVHVEEVPDAGVIEELPDWLRDLGQAEPSSKEAHPAEQPPDWLRIQAEEIKAESAKEPELPEWLSDTGELVERTTQPTSPQEWMLTEAKPVVEEPIVTEHEEERPAAQPTPITPKPTGVLSRIPLQEKESDMLLQAQDALDQGLLNAAMDVYTRLIKKGRMLDEVIHDLHEAIYRFPVDMIVWQTLGDAYMRANRLQEALDAYTKAEELLR